MRVRTNKRLQPATAGQVQDTDAVFAYSYTPIRLSFGLWLPPASLTPRLRQRSVNIQTTHTHTNTATIIQAAKTSTPNAISPATTPAASAVLLRYS